MTWDEYLMGAAVHAASKSKDSTKVGAVLAKGNTTLITSYNGPPRGVDDRSERFERPAKYLYAAHAEENLITTAARHGVTCEGARVFVTHFPCSSCARMLIQAGVTEVVYGPGTTSMPHEQFTAAYAMFGEAGVKVRGV